MNYSSLFFFFFFGILLLFVMFPTCSLVRSFMEQHRIAAEILWKLCSYERIWSLESRRLVSTISRWNHARKGKFYSCSSFNILTNLKGAKDVLLRYSSVAKALLDVYPSIGLDISKMTKLQSSISPLCLFLSSFLFSLILWSFSDSALNYIPIRRNFFGSKFRRRMYFEMYAEENKFDPLIPANWYIQSRKQIVSYKVCFLSSSFLFSSINYSVSSREFKTSYRIIIIA